MENNLTIQADSLNDVWHMLLNSLVNDYDHTPAPRGFKTREITGVVLRINDLRQNILFNPLRNINYKFMVAEWIWIAMGLEDVKTLTQYNGQMGRFSDDGKTLAGAYGPRLLNQWAYVIENMSHDAVSRQAVATIWTPNPNPSKDIPCTISLQFIAREGRLNMIVTMRSSDVWLGLPYDVFTFAQLGNGIAGALNLEPGYLQMQLGSSHIYEDNVAKAEEIINEHVYHDGIVSPRLPHTPPSWMKLEVEHPHHALGRIGAIDQPWTSYSNVFRAETWSAAREILQGL